MRYQNRNSDFHLPPEQVAHLISAARSTRDRLILSLFAYTGLRRAELRDVLKQDINPDQREILIRNGKGTKQRLIFYPADLDSLLASQMQDNSPGPLFPGRGGNPLSLRAINLIVARVGVAAGIQNPNPRYQNITPHLLRHSMARNWKRAGGSLETLQKVLGHASLKTTLDLYGTESMDDTKRNYLEVAPSLLSAPSTATSTVNF